MACNAHPILVLRSIDFSFNVLRLKKWLRDPSNFRDTSEKSSRSTGTQILPIAVARHRLPPFPSCCFLRIIVAPEGPQQLIPHVRHLTLAADRHEHAGTEHECLRPVSFEQHRFVDRFRRRSVAFHLFFLSLCCLHAGEGKTEG